MISIAKHRICKIETIFRNLVFSRISFKSQDDVILHLSLIAFFTVFEIYTYALMSTLCIFHLDRPGKGIHSEKLFQ